MNEQDIKNKINKVIPLSKTNLFYKKKLILSSNTIKKLETDIKSNINNPKKDKQVYVIRVVYDPDDKSSVITVNCSKKIITPELELVNVVGSMKTIIFTQEDLDTLGFTKGILNKIISSIDKKTLSKSITVNINQIV